MFSLEKPKSRWKVITAVLGSGAEQTVAPPGLVPGKMESSATSRTGGRFRAANGTRIPNLGQQTAVFSTPEGRSWSLRFQIAGMGHPVVSGSQLAWTGRAVEFDKDAATIVHKQSGRRLRLQRVGGVYVLRIRVREVPDETSGFSRHGK